MKAVRKKIGIYGGTFNPIHVGHIQIARTMTERGIVDEVWMMISPLNPFKQGSTDILPDNMRLALTEKALEGEDRIVASDYEFHLPLPSYTWNTLQNLSRDYPDCDFTLVIGADNWASFDRWSHPEEIIENYKIAVYPRRDYDIDESSLPQNVTIVSMPLIDVSSTDIRQRIRKGLSVRKLLPKSIIDDCKKLYLREHKTKN